MDNISLMGVKASQATVLGDQTCHEIPVVQRRKLAFARMQCKLIRLWMCSLF